MFKKLQSLLIAAMLSLTLFVSCKKEGTETADTTIDKSTLFEVMKLPTQNAKKTAFGALNSSEKLELWKIQFNNILKEQEETLTSEQSLFIKKLITNVSADIYSKDQTAYQKARQEMAIYEAEMKDLFSHEYIVYHFTQLQNPLSKTQVILLNKKVIGGANVLDDPEDGEIDDGLVPKCNCSRLSDWCTWGKTCKWPDDHFGCTYVIQACGTMWGSNCDGRCM